MIYLIGGSPRCGKTTFSKQFADKMHVPWVSTDLLHSFLKGFLSEEEYRKKFLHKEITNSTARQQLLVEIANAKIMWPGTKRLISSFAKWKYDYIVEGVHLFPQFVQQLKKYPEVWKQVKVIYLIKKDPKMILDGFSRSDPRQDWLLKVAKTEEDLKKAADMVRMKSLYIEKHAKKYGFQVINTEMNFNKTLKLVMKDF